MLNDYKLVLAVPATSQLHLMHKIIGNDPFWWLYRMDRYALSHDERGVLRRFRAVVVLALCTHPELTVGKGPTGFSHDPSGTPDPNPFRQPPGGGMFGQPPGGGMFGAGNLNRCDSDYVRGHPEG